MYTHTLPDSRDHTGELLPICTHTHPVFGGIPASHYPHTSTPTTHTRKVFSTPTQSPTLLPKPAPPFLAATSRLSLTAQSMVPKLRCRRAKPILMQLPVAAAQTAGARELCIHPAPSMAQWSKLLARAACALTLKSWGFLDK